MASRIIHLAIAQKLIDAHPVANADRFFFGSILPDAGADRSSHLLRVLPDSGRRTYDLTGFRRRFGARMAADDLYLGFYLHLVQDICFRNYIYNTCGWDPRPEGNPARLHRDYARINRHVIDAYGLSPRLTVPDDFDRLPLPGDCRYDAEGFCRACLGDFDPAPEGEIFFFHPEMADAFIAPATDACLREMAALRGDGAHIDEIALAWSHKEARP